MCGARLCTESASLNSVQPLHTRLGGLCVGVSVYTLLLMGLVAQAYLGESGVTGPAL